MIVLEALLIVLLVSVWVPEFVVTVLSISNVAVLPDTVVVIPVPPVRVKVSPALRDDEVEESSTIVNISLPVPSANSLIVITSALTGAVTNVNVPDDTVYSFVGLW